MRRFTGPPVNGTALLLVAVRGLRVEANTCGSSAAHCAAERIPLATVVTHTDALDGVSQVGLSYGR